MPTGFYSLREKKSKYKAQNRYSKQSIQWLNYMKTIGFNILHEENYIHGVIRIENYKVDGFDPISKTIFEFYGCYFHGCPCGVHYDTKKWSRTLEREEHLRELGYSLISISSCEWNKLPESKEWYQTEELSECTYKDIINGILNDELFGIVKYSIHVPEYLISKFSEFPPIFKNVEIRMEDIGDQIQEYSTSIYRRTGVKKSLISSVWGEGIVTLSHRPLKYLRGLCFKVSEQAR